MEKTMIPESPHVFDDIVVGAGLAGSLLAFSLLRATRKVLIIDKGQEASSSSVAAGVINPITGKNFIKSWNIDIFLPEALSTYKQIESFLGIKIIYKKNIIRSLATPGIENHWDSRKIDESYSQYVVDAADISHFRDEIKMKGRLAEIKESYRIDIGLFISAFKKHMKDTGSFLEADMDHSMLNIFENRVEYKNYKAKNIFFCEGYKGAINPLFPGLSFALTLGQASVIHVKGSKIDKMVKEDNFLVPFENENFWIGGGYKNITVEESFLLVEKPDQERPIEEFITKPFTLLQTKYAVRPTTKTRRPFVLQHREFKNVYFLNGLGAKGSSLAPYYVKKMVGHIVTGEPLVLIDDM